MNGDVGFHLEPGNLWDHPEGPRPSSELERRIADADAAVRAKYRAGAVGFYDWPVKSTAEERRQIGEVAERLREKSDGALLFGIGGSHLGPAAVHQALLSPEADAAYPLRWVSNVDPAAIRSAEYFLEKHPRAAAVVISKSGGTTETLSAFFHFAKRLDPKRLVVITDPQSGNLRRLADREGWMSLPVPPNVGGRFSVHTAVGLLPVALAKLSFENLLDGARLMRESFERTAPRENPAYLLAAAFHGWDTAKGRRVQYFMPYWSTLRLLADWFVQLWGESLGKRLIRDPRTAVGFTPVAALGTTDQHSLLQLMKEGPPDKVVGFVDVKAPAGGPAVTAPPFDPGDGKFLVGQDFGRLSSLALQATQTSLQNAGVPTYRLTLDRLDETTLGAFFFFFETACAFAGELYGVDAFNQPGVEEAKRLLRQSL